MVRLGEIGPLAVFLASNSVGLLADTIHNFADALTALPLWVAFVLGARTANARYTFGYRRAEDLAGLFILAMIALSSIVAAIESVIRLVNQEPIGNLFADAQTMLDQIIAQKWLTAKGVAALWPALRRCRRPRTRESARRASAMRSHVPSVLASSTSTSSQPRSRPAKAAATSRASGRTLSEIGRAHV